MRDVNGVELQPGGFDEIRAEIEASYALSEDIWRDLEASRRVTSVSEELDDEGNVVSRTTVTEDRPPDLSLFEKIVGERKKRGDLRYRAAVALRKATPL